MRRYAFISLFVVVCLVALSVTIAPAVNAATVSGNPNIDVFLPDSDVDPGGEQTIQLELRNSGVVTQNGQQQFESFVTLARAVSVDVSSNDGDVSVQTGEQPVQDIPRGQPVTVPVTVEVPRGESGEVELDVTVRYDYYERVEHTGSQINSTRTESQTRTTEVTINVQDEPVFSVDSVDADVAAGQSGVATVDITNTGESDLSASRVQLTSTTQTLQLDGTQQTSVYIGSWDEDDTQTVDVPISFADGAQFNEYYVSGSVLFRDDTGERTSAPIDGFAVGPDGGDRINFIGQRTTTPIGGVGQSSLILTNKADFQLRDAELTLTSNTQALKFEGQRTSTSIGIGDWNSKETKQLPFSLRASEDAIQTSYPINAVVQYETPDGVQNAYTIPSVSVQPNKQQQFDVSIEQSTVRRGEEGDVSVTVTNTGPRDVSNVEISPSAAGDITFVGGNRNVENLNDGESVTVSLRAESPREINNPDQSIGIDVTHDSPTVSTRQTQSELRTIQIGGVKDNFNVNRVTDAPLNPGESRQLAVEVTNLRDDDISDIDVKFTGDGPVSVSQDSSFVKRLQSEETTQLNVTVSVSGAALTNTQPVEVDFQYETDTGDTRLSKVYSVPADIEQPEESSGPPVALFGVLLLVIGAGVGAAYNYREELTERR